MNTKESIVKQHEENQEWRNKLDFYKDEIKILNNRLEELVTKNTVEEATAEIEKYQNQLIVQRNNIDEIEHLVKMNDQALLKIVDENSDASDHRRKVVYHTKEKDLVETFELNFAELRENFNQFSAKWL